MPKIIFSVKKTGACPLCKMNNNCHIQRSTIEFLSNEVKDKYDDELELVIYRCPEFFEKNT